MCKIESVPDTFTIPRKNPAYLKRNAEGRTKSFIGIHPDGVFKSAWCWKWLSRVPCCVLNVVDYTNGDWEHTMRETEKMFFTEIDMLKDRLHTRDRTTNVISLLIVSDDCNESLMNDLASNLRHGSARTVYAVKLSEIQSGGIKTASATIQRTMRSVRHHASTCYTRQMRKYRMHRVDKRTQRALDVRHSFKQGFMYEFLGNTDKAVSCYRDAFESASLLRKEDTKLSSSFGIKAIVGLINFRMTHALLNSNRVYEAIVQFNNFSRSYGHRVEADEYVPRHWGWMTEIYTEFGTLLERCDDEHKIPIHECHDDGQRLDSLFREGYYYDYAARLAMKRKEASTRAFRRKSLNIKRISGKKNMNYEVAREPRWVGGNPIVTPTQFSISDLAPYLHQQQQKQLQHGSSSPTKTNGEIRRRRRGATSERSPSLDGTEDATNKVKQAVPNPFECIESDVQHDRIILDLLARVRVSQSLFPSDKSDLDRSQVQETTTLLLTPKPSRRAEAYENLPGKTVQISKDERGHLGIKFDDSLKVLAVSPWAKRFGITPGQTLLVCNGMRLRNTQDVLGSIPKGNKPFSLKVLGQDETLNDQDDDEDKDEETQSRYRTRAMLDILEAENHLNLQHFRECLQCLKLPLQLARFEGWIVPLAKCLEIALRAQLGLKENLEQCIEDALELLSPSFNLSQDQRQRLERDILIPSWKDVESQRVWSVRSCNQQSAICVIPSFSPSTASAGDVVTCTAQVKSFIPSNLAISCMRFRFDDKAYNCEWKGSEVLAPGIMSGLDVSLKIERLNSDKTLRLESVEIECVPQGLTFPVRLEVKIAPDSDVLDLLRPESRVTMRWKHVEPALVDAPHFMSLSILIRGEEFVLGETKNAKTGDVCGRDVRVLFEFEDSNLSTPVLRIHSDDSDVENKNVLKLPNLIANEKQNVRVSLLGSSTTPPTTLRATVQYIDTNNCLVKKTRNISVSFSDALSASFQFQSVRPHTGDDASFASNSPLLMNMIISANNHRHDIVLLDTNVNVPDNTLVSIRSLSSLHNDGVQLDPRDEYIFGYQVIPKCAVKFKSWGDVSVKWKLRDTPFETDATVTTFSLPEINVLVEPFRVELKSPTRGSVGVPFTFDMTISNQSKFTESFSISINVDSEVSSFCVAGDTKYVMSLSAGDSKSHRIVLIPLVVGLLALPNVNIFTENSKKNLLSEVDRRKIFVLGS